MHHHLVINRLEDLIMWKVLQNHNSLVPVYTVSLYLGSLSLKRVSQLRQDPASTLAAETGRPPQSLFLWTPPILERFLIHVNMISQIRDCDTWKRPC